MIKITCTLEVVVKDIIPTQRELDWINEDLGQIITDRVQSYLTNKYSKYNSEVTTKIESTDEVDINCL